jgi:TolA-binding protein
VPSQSTQQAVPPQSTQPTTGISATPPVESVASISSSASTTEVTPSVPSAPPLFAADVYLKQAKDEFDATRVAAAISLLDQFSQYYPPDSTMLSDELYWLYGQFYEANSPSRNILLSLDYYRRLINEYPQSSRCNDARRRISYLERYFINNR